MIQKNDGRTIELMATIPKSILLNTLTEAIEKKGKNRISNLADLLYSGFELSARGTATLTEHAHRFELQHQEIQNSIEIMREGFKGIEKRFEAVDKRFEAVDKRFDDLIHHLDKRFSLLAWLIGIGFVAMNSIMLIIKFFD